MNPTEATIPASPNVQVLGDAVILRGPAALDAYRLMTEGIGLVQRRDGWNPPPRLLQVVAALKAVSSSRCASSGIAEIAELRKEPNSAMLRTGEVVGVEEVAHMFGVGTRHVRHLAPSLGGWKTTGRGAPWRFDRGLVQAYIDAEGRR